MARRAPVGRVHASRGLGRAELPQPAPPVANAAEWCRWCGFGKTEAGAGIGSHVVLNGDGRRSGRHRASPGSRRSELHKHFEDTGERP